MSPSAQSSLFLSLRALCIRSRKSLQNKCNFTKWYLAQMFRVCLLNRSFCKREKDTSRWNVNLFPDSRMKTIFVISLCLGLTTGHFRGPHHPKSSVSHHHYTPQKEIKLTEDSELLHDATWVEKTVRIKIINNYKFQTCILAVTCNKYLR